MNGETVGFRLFVILNNIVFRGYIKAVFNAKSHNILIFIFFFVFTTPEKVYITVVFPEGLCGCALVLWSAGVTFVVYKILVYTQSKCCISFLRTKFTLFLVQLELPQGFLLSLTVFVVFMNRISI